MDVNDMHVLKYSVHTYLYSEVDLFPSRWPWGAAFLPSPSSKYKVRSGLKPCSALCTGLDGETWQVACLVGYGEIATNCVRIRERSAESIHGDSVTMISR